MKSLMLFCCLCCLMACKKDKSGQNYWGEMSVLRNGEPWIGEIVATQHTFSPEKVNISIEDLMEEEMNLDNLYFFKIPKASGRYKLIYTINQPPDDSLVGARYFQSNDDILYGVYDLAKNDSTSYLEITQYDARKGELWGKFDLTLYRTSFGSASPDTLIFTNGTFHTRIDD